MTLTEYELAERAAILEYDSGMGLTRSQAEAMARKQIEDAARMERQRGEQVEMWRR